MICQEKSWELTRWIGREIGYIFTGQGKIVDARADLPGVEGAGGGGAKGETGSLVDAEAGGAMGV